MIFFIVAFCAGIVLSGVNILFFKDFLKIAEWKIIVFVFVTIIGVFAVDAIIAFLVKKLPEAWFKKDGIFKIFKWEKKYYQSIGIKKWKDKIPEWGKLANFSKKKLVDPTNNEYVAKFIVECKYGEVIHFLSMLLGFSVIFICPLYMWLNIGLPVGVINAFLNYPSYCILRYNRPKLETIYKMNLRKQERVNKALQVAPSSERGENA